MIDLAAQASRSDRRALVTPRERVLKTLRHEQPDRIPLDLGGTESSGITGIAYNRLRRHLGLPPGATQIFDVYQQIAKVEAFRKHRDY